MSEPFTYRIPKDSIRVVDGDTIKATLELGFDVLMHKQSIRFAKINTPESRTRNLAEKALGLAAKDRLIEILDEAEVVAVQSLGKGKFGRILGIVFADGVDVNAKLVEEGHARWYDGGARQPWV